MADIVIHDVDDDVIETMKMRARAKGKSLEQEIRDLLYSQRRLKPEEKAAISSEILAKTSRLVPELTAEERREGLE